MKCLSVSPAYAWAISIGLKPLETRTWRTKYRGPILIAASKKLNQEHYDYLRSIGIQLPRKEELEYGRIVATAHLDECVPFTKELEPQALCRVYPGYGFWLSGVKMLHPAVPVKGKLGLYDVSWPTTL